jgi:hypothetical protein
MCGVFTLFFSFYYILPKIPCWVHASRRKRYLRNMFRKKFGIKINMCQKKLWLIWRYNIGFGCNYRCRPTIFFLIRIVNVESILGRLGTSAISDLLYLPWVIVKMENVVELRLAGEIEVLRENLPQRHFFYLVLLNMHPLVLQISIFHMYTHINTVDNKSGCSWWQTPVDLV